MGLRLANKHHKEPGEQHETYAVGLDRLDRALARDEIVRKVAASWAIANTGRATIARAELIRLGAETATVRVYFTWDSV